MRLLIDAGNTRVKWLVLDDKGPVLRGFGLQGKGDLFADVEPLAPQITRVAISTVASETVRAQLMADLGNFIGAPAICYWTEKSRGGLTCAYDDYRTMGADRWHALYAAWLRYGCSLAVIDAGSAVTIDMVSQGGQHLGGYILPGRAMMLRSLRQEAARIIFPEQGSRAMSPGRSTGECVRHGQHWLWRAMSEKLENDCTEAGINTIVVTGGDAAELEVLGLGAIHVPDLVFEGLAAIDLESSR